jgi:hypothetical protein
MTFLEDRKKIIKDIVRDKKWQICQEDCKCNANDCQQKGRREEFEGEENVSSVINGDPTWMAANFTEKTFSSEFIEATRDFLNARKIHSKRKD